MKVVLRIVYCCAITTMFGSVGQAAEWMTNYRDAIEQARSEKKPLLVVFEKASHRLLQAGEPTSVDAATSEKKTAKSSDALLDAYKLCRVDVGTKDGQALAISGWWAN